MQTTKNGRAENASESKSRSGSKDKHFFTALWTASSAQGQFTYS
jgi:hypothetical protein